VHWAALFLIYIDEFQVYKANILKLLIAKVQEFGQILSKTVYSSPHGVL
jgi:hypothetical protein